MATTTSSSTWTIAHSAELYNLPGWSDDFFSIGEHGHILVHPYGSGGPRVDLRALVDEVRDRGIDPPLVVRFSDILKARIDSITGAFRQAIEEYDYRNAYRGVYPIKVNQDRYVVERLIDCGFEDHFGLEAGSKPELLAVLAMLRDPEALIVCNGYKDEEYVESALLASKLGRAIFLVLEKPSELDVVLEGFRRTSVRPRLGIRARLSTGGAGHWEASGGDRSKFGFGSRELLDAVTYLRRHGLLECLELLHFHIGSQISSIRSVKNALREASRLYVELVKIGAPLSYLDVGGGLGVDYDGSQTDFHSSTNYTLQEYANDVVAGVMEVCDPEGISHPVLVSESGRATVAHHAVLIVEALGSRERTMGEVPTSVPEAAAPPVVYLFEAFQNLSAENLLESYHDVITYREDCLNLFKLGHLSLEHRALAEDLFWMTCQRIQALLGNEEAPEELEGLETALAEIFFCNFSLFQSIPDAWAIDQLFPIVPIQRLDEEPTRRAVLADVTCDSDGTIDQFIGDREFKSVLELHSMDARPYYLGVFLVGAYQEILGDLHNLFGDTNTVNVSLDPEGGYSLDDVITGNSVTDVLGFVRYQRQELVARVRRWSEQAIRSGNMTLEESRKLLRVYEEGLSGYTYPERE